MIDRTSARKGGFAVGDRIEVALGGQARPFTVPGSLATAPPIRLAAARWPSSACRPRSGSSGWPASTARSTSRPPAAFPPRNCAPR